jgi:lactoylglutathione lyase
VTAHQARLAGDGIESVAENGTCCFAHQEKVWVDGPDGAWEVYAVVADSDDFGASSAHANDETIDALCCASVPESEARCC